MATQGRMSVLMMGWSMRTWEVVRVTYKYVKKWTFFNIKYIYDKFVSIAIGVEEPPS